jgi:tRNA-dihydrouridine synthase B
MIIGNINIEKGILLAPMDDVTDSSFRKICKRFGADIVYSEFISSEGLIRDAKKSIRKILFTDEERPIGVQIVGHNVESMLEAAMIAESYSPEFIDINCGCPVRKVAGRGSGAGLLKDLPTLEKMIDAIVKSVKLPVTLKTRLGWDDKNLNILEVAKMCEGLGVKALTIHCRTGQQGYKGNVDWSWIPKIKSVVNIPIIANGDILTPQNVEYLFNNTGCDAVMIGRATIGNPWIFEKIKHYIKTGELIPDVNIFERIRVCIEHLKMSIDFKGEWAGVVEFRKYYAGYLRDQKHIAKVRNDLMPFTELAPILEILDEYMYSLKNPVDEPKKNVSEVL